MKTRSILMTTLCSLMLGMSFASCADDDDFENIGITPDDGKDQYYVLNEGAWGANNANITGFVYNEKNSTFESMGDIYLGINKQQLGDVANAMMEEDDNIYVVLNGSKYVARLDLTIKEQARYTFPETEGAPRCIDVEDDYAYVTQYGGQVSKLHIEDMTLVGTFKGGDNLEGIVEKNGKLYVANSYTVDGSNNWIYNKEVFVIDAKTMTLEKTISVVDNPTKMYEINDKVYLISVGNYADVAGALQIIDTQSNTARTILNDVTKITEGHNGVIYGVRSTYDENWQLTNSFFLYSPKADEVSHTSFLKDAPSSFATDAIYMLEVDEETGFIYVGTSDYTTNGTIYQFDQSGKFVQSFDSGGINPSAMIFVD